ncbi:MAG: extracellular solute-binding protein [Alphaproteobacteria bacterium]|nr:extracellular solute-binding protein [Alphaproteobacteria bacterium]
MRRALLLAVLMAGVLALPARADLKALAAAADKEGQVTWYTSHYPTEVTEQIGRAFTAKHPGVKANVIRVTSQVAYQRLTQDIAKGVPQCDVFSSADIGHYVILSKQGRFATYEPENERQLSPEFQNFDAARTYYPTSMNLVFLAWNTKKVTQEQAPKRWSDLLDPKWKGQISLGHPGFSGAVGTWTSALVKLYGWDFFEKLEKNRPLVGRSINDTTTMLNAGERSVAHVTGAAIESAARGNPIGYGYAEDGTVVVLNASAVMANAPHPNAARLFLEFLLGPEHAEISMIYGREPIRPDVTPAPGVKRVSELKILPQTPEELAERIPQAIERWRDIFGN